MKISFRLEHVKCIEIDDSQLVPKENDDEKIKRFIDIQKPMTKVILANTQPIYIDQDMVGYVRNNMLIFED